MSVAELKARQIVALAERGTPLEQVIEQLGYRSKDALWVFCKRRGIGDAYNSLPRAECEIAGCDKTSFSRHRCQKHYRAAQAAGEFAYADDAYALAWEREQMTKAG